MIAVEDFGSGALQRVAVYPREIVRTALGHNAAGVVFAHNHPSGRAEPSELDKALTRQIQAQQQIAANAAQLDAPDGVSSYKPFLVQSMQYRVSGMQGLQKALRSLEIKRFGLIGDGADKEVDDETLTSKLTVPNAERIFFLGQAFAKGWDVEKVFELTKIDRWFLVQIEEIVKIELELETTSLDAISADELRTLKKKGFSDRRLAKLLKTTEGEVRARRHALNVRPVYKRIDTCAAEFASPTAYMYSTYETPFIGAPANEAQPSDAKKIVILGGGPNRIGQGIEFDYCCCHACFALSDAGYETIMINCNPETVSTDYDTSDRLYFEPLTADLPTTLDELRQLPL